MKQTAYSLTEPLSHGENILTQMSLWAQKIEIKPKPNAVDFVAAGNFPELWAMLVDYY